MVNKLDLALEKRLNKTTMDEAEKTYEELFSILKAYSFKLAMQKEVEMLKDMLMKYTVIPWKRRKTTYRTIRRTCAKRNRRK